MAAAWTQEFLQAIGFGAIPGYRRVAALGNNPDVDTATVPEDVWSGGGVYPWMTSATSLEMVSTSAADSAAGTGARTVVWQQLDTGYAEFTQSVTLNGLTPVALPRQAFRNQAGLITSAGSGKTNAGDIILRDAGGGTVRAIIPAGYGITRQSIFTVPAGFTLSINSTLFAITKAGGVDKNVTMTNYIQSPAGFYRMPLEVSISQTAPYRHDGLPGIILAEKTDFALRVVEASSDNVSVTGAFLGVLKANTMT